MEIWILQRNKEYLVHESLTPAQRCREICEELLVDLQVAVANGQDCGICQNQLFDRPDVHERLVKLAASYTAPPRQIRNTRAERYFARRHRRRLGETAGGVHGHRLAVEVFNFHRGVTDAIKKIGAVVEAAEENCCHPVKLECGHVFGRDCICAVSSSSSFHLLLLLSCDLFALY